MKKSQPVLTIILLLAFLFVGLFVFVIGAVKYPISRAIMDRFSRDRSMDSFTFERYQIIRLPLLLVGGGISLGSGLGFIFIRRTDRLLGNLRNKVRQFWINFCVDAKAFRKDLRHPNFSRWEWLILGLLILLAFAGSWVWVEKPMQHDESYTFIAFAQRPFIHIISDYHLPNNHVLNSILIHILYKIFGNPSPFIVRLPSLLAGVICVPLTYFWARKQFGVFAAITAAGLVGTLPWVKLQSTNGRGYMLMAIFTLLMVILAERVRGKKDRFAWILLILATVLNFYTLPIALYPLGIIVLWLVISAVRGDIAAAYGGFRHFLKYLVVYGVASGILVFILYSPIFLFGSGWDSFFNNPFVESLGWQAFLQTLPIRLGETIRDWQLDLPVWFSVILGIGIFFSMIFHRPGKPGKTSLQLCVLIALTLIFVVQRPNPWTRVWTFILPIVLTWAAAGWFLAVQRLIREKEKQTFLLKIMLIVFLAMIIGLSVQHLLQNLQYIQGEKGQEETVTVELQQIISSDDVVITSGGFGPAFWYYFDRYGMPLTTIVNPDLESDWENLYLVVDDRYESTPEALLDKELPEAMPCELESVELIYSYGHYLVFTSHCQ